MMKTSAAVNHTVLEDNAQVKVTDKFWLNYMELIRTEMLPYQWRVLNDLEDIEIAKERDADYIPSEKSHAIENFKIAAGRSRGHHYGMVFQDSDVYKWLEAAAYTLARGPEDKKLREAADSVVELIAAAQEDDGEPFEEKMERLTSELATLFGEGQRLEDEINKQLNTIGYTCKISTFQTEQLNILRDILRECDVLSENVLRSICKRAIVELNKFEKDSGIAFFSYEYPEHLTFFDKLCLETIGMAKTYNEVHPKLEDYIMFALKEEYEKVTPQDAFFIGYADYYEDREPLMKLRRMFYKMLDEHYDTKELEPYHL